MKTGLKLIFHKGLHAFGNTWFRQKNSKLMNTFDPKNYLHGIKNFHSGFKMIFISNGNQYRLVELPVFDYKKISYN